MLDIVTFILEMKTLRLREVKHLAQGQITELGHEPTPVISRARDQNHSTTDLCLEWQRLCLAQAVSVMPGLERSSQPSDRFLS